MRSKLTFSLLAVLPFLFLASCAEGHPTYFAYNKDVPRLLDGRYVRYDYRIILKNDPNFPHRSEDRPDAHPGVTIMGGDHVDYFTVMGEDEDFSWLIDGPIVFVLPKYMDGKISNWTWQDYTFVVRERGVTLEMFGRKLDNLYRVAVAPDYSERDKQYDDSLEFLYNPDVGVMAFTYIPNVDKPLHPAFTYWSTQKLGFGAQRQAEQTWPGYVIED